MLNNNKFKINFDEFNKIHYTIQDCPVIVLAQIFKFINRPGFKFNKNLGICIQPCLVDDKFVAWSLWWSYEDGEYDRLYSVDGDLIKNNYNRDVWPCGNVDDFCFNNVDEVRDLLFKKLASYVAVANNTNNSNSAMSKFRLFKF